MNNKQYAVVTTISTFYHYYVVDLETLQSQNPDGVADATWLSDLVALEEVNEFYQGHLGEQIMSSKLLDEYAMLNFFENTYPQFTDWPDDKKLNWIKNLNEHLR